jgi:hypothetical protein
MDIKADVYRAKAARCEEQAKNERHRNAREWRLTLARVYQVLATEAESAAQKPAESVDYYWSCWL